MGMVSARSKPYWIPALLAAGSSVVIGAAGFFLARSGGRPDPGHEHAAGAGFFEDLLKIYTPRRACMDYEAPVIWLHLVSDLLISLAYFSIPLTLVYFVRRRRDLAFNWIFWMFATFIFACGTTHLVGVLDLWQPLYKVDGLVKAVTAVVSLTTAAMLWPLIPKALALPSPAQLEQRVEERTHELERANDALRSEVAAREEAETERARLVESERAARGEAERANRAKDEFLASLSHELRTPIHAVAGWCQLLQMDPAPERVREGLTVIERNVQAQSRLINDLLDMNRILSGRFRLDLGTVDLAEVITSAVESVRPAATAKHIRLKTELDEIDGTVTGDADRLQQVLWNLLSNAVTYTPRNGSIEVRLQQIGTTARITVTDDGEGITPEFLPHVFERFRQAEPRNPQHQGGLGLGLSIVLHLVELHGGTVHAHSDGKSQGTSFTVELPVRAGQRAPRTAPSPVVIERSLAGLQILVIEDDADARSLVERCLQDAGATVVACVDAAAGFERLRSHPPDVLLCDLGLPGEDGFSLIRRVRELPASKGGLTPAIAVTAFARPEDKQRSLMAGFQAHVAKPFAPKDLIAVIRGLTSIFGSPEVS